MKETGFEVDDEIADQLRELGAPPEVIAAARQKVATTEDFELFDDNEGSFKVFAAMQTQWRIAGMNGTPYGLDYAPLRDVMRLVGIPRKAECQIFDDVRVMEATALEVFRERAS